MTSSPWISSIIVFLLFCYVLVCLFGNRWATSVSDYSVGNRRRILSICRLEIIMTLLNIFAYHQLIVYFDYENQTEYCDRRKQAKVKSRVSMGLVIFFILSQLVYLMYYAPDWLQWLLFDVTTLAAGIWTNLLAFVCGFFVVNIVFWLFKKNELTTRILSFIINIKYIGELLTNRRTQIKWTVIITFILSFIMWISCDNISVKYRNIPIKNFSGDMKSLTFAVISDVHIGASVHEEQVLTVSDKLLKLDVDAVLIVGDMVDGPRSLLEPRLRPFWNVVRRFPTYFVTGNHEYYYGDVREWIKLYQEHGITVLQNEHSMFHGICLAGVNDISSGKTGIKNHFMKASHALQGCPKNATKVLMAHNPASIRDFTNEDLNSIDLILSGHTHAGQFYVVVPLVYLSLPYYYGMYNLAHGKLMVSAGTLYQGPNMKMVGMSEIWVVNLIES